LDGSLQSLDLFSRYEIQNGGYDRTVAAILDFRSAYKNRNFVEDLPMIIPGQFGFNCPGGFKEEAS
jgi:hypothetical protein